MMTEARAEVPATTIAATAAGDVPAAQAAKRFHPVTTLPRSAASGLTVTAGVDAGVRPRPVLLACS
jgi:hypothetical protein